MARIVRSAGFQSDLESIWLYIAEDSPTAADSFVEKLDESLRLLGDFPRLGAPRPELGPNIRAWRHGEYMIFYRHTGTSVELVRLVHGHRDLKADLIK